MITIVILMTLITKKKTMNILNVNLKYKIKLNNIKFNLK